jgi:hypothetical protein
MKFVTINLPCSALHVGYKENYIEEVTNIQFLGLQIDKHLNWKNNIPKLSGACYVLRSMVHASDITTLKSIYVAYFHSSIKRGITVWGNFSSSAKIFTLQKKIIRILAAAPPKTLCRSLFKNLEILPIPCDCILSKLNFVVNNQESFQTNLFVHIINSRNKYRLHRSNTNFSCFQKGTFYAGIRIFSSLPHSLSILMNDKAKFKVALKKYLHTHFLLLCRLIFYV